MKVISTRIQFYYWAFILFLSCVIPSLLAAQSLPAGFRNVKVQDGYTSPTGMAFTPNGQKLFVWDKAGRVWISVWNGSQYIKQTTPALDISDEVGNWRDFGLLSFCLDPNYDQNGLVYLFYVVDRYHLFNAGTSTYNPAQNEYNNASISRVTRYQFLTVNGTTNADITSRRVLLGETRSTGVPLTHNSHAGGTILFGRDGSLLISTGDNANFNGIDMGSSNGTYFQAAINDGIMRANENVGAFRAQMVNSFCGKVLRLDPATGDGLASNPFFDTTNPRSAQSRVWAMGFRNPYRMAIQPNTGSTSIADGNPGTLLVGDVGADTWEDLHVIRQGGENAGWPMFEGMNEHPQYGPASRTMDNKDEPNPTNTCALPFLRFGDLLKQSTNPDLTTVQALNPCSQQPLPGLQRRYFHSRPALDWKHGEDIAQVPTFNGSVATGTTISPTGTPTVGKPFRGYALTGGAYYSGTAFPAAYRDTYYFADYTLNWIRAASLNSDGTIREVREFLPQNIGKGIVDVEYGAHDGALYYVNINSGEIMKISFGGNQPPIAVLSADRQNGGSPLTVNFRASSSSDPDGDPLTYAWDFGDGTTSTLQNPTKVFSGSARQGFTVRLTVTDATGLTDTKTTVISINNAAPTARITAPVTNTQYLLDRQTTYRLTATVGDENPNSLTYAWQVTLRHNNHEHREPVVTDASPTVVISPVGCDGETYYYLITLKVTDNGGLTASDSVKVYPNCNSVKLTVTNAKATPDINAVLVSWTNPTVSYDNVLVVAKAGSGFSDVPKQTGYAANASFTGNGAVLEGGKVVYQGRNQSVLVTNLVGGQPYFFRIYTRSGVVWTGGMEVSAVPAAISFDPSACYRITSRVSGEVLGVENGGITEGAIVKQRTDANLAWQQWKLTATGDGYYQLTASHSGKALDVVGASIQNQASMEQSTYTGQPHQQWAIQRDAQGYYQFVARQSGKLLDVEGSNRNQGGNIIQFTANGGQSQQWSVEQRTCTAPIAVSFDPSACYRITSRVSGKVLGVEGGKTTDGAPVKQRTDANQAWQQWKLTGIDGGYYQITATHSGKVLDVVGASKQDQASVEQSAYIGQPHQQWAIQRDVQGYYQFVARHSGKVLDVEGSNRNEGGNVIQFTTNGGQPQQWIITAATCPVGSARFSTEQEATVHVENPESTPDAFRLWPNPARDYVLIDLRYAAGQSADIAVIDGTGKVVHQALVQTDTEPVYRINTTLFNDLHYLITVKAAGRERATLRLLVVK